MRRARGLVVLDHYAKAVGTTTTCVGAVGCTQHIMGLQTPRTCTMCVSLRNVCIQTLHLAPASLNWSNNHNCHMTGMLQCTDDVQW